MHLAPSPRWPVFGALIVGALVVAVFTYALLTNAGGEALPASGGRYVEGVLRRPERINPLFAGANPTDADLAALVFSGLVRLGPDGTPQPDLAERWEITGGGQRYVLHLRRGVAWHDGEPFDADDVVFTYRAIADPAFKGDPALAQLMQGVIISARDAYTVEFSLEQAYAPFLAYLTVGILPHHLLDGLDANGLLNDPFNVRPVGTGPFKLRSVTDDSVDLTPNTTYHFGPPRIARLEFRVLPDAMALATALRGRDIDAALLPPGALGAAFDFLDDTDAYVRRDLVPTSFFMLYLDTRSELFRDASVRLALRRAINVQALIDGLAGGRGARVDSMVPEASWAYADARQPGFDPGAAAALLERAGWRRGPDGVRTRAGLRLAFTLDTADEPLRIAIAESVAQQWRSIGVRADVQALNADTFVGQHLLSRSYTAALALVDPGPDPDPYPFWHSSQIASPGRNLANYQDPIIDDKVERARQTTDTARRQQLYAEFAELIADAVPSIPLFAPTHTYVQTARLQGFEPGMIVARASRFSNVHEWYLETRPR